MLLLSKQLVVITFSALSLSLTHTNIHVLSHSHTHSELTFSIVIPQKQGQLKSGRGVLRIRNTGFTITTCDNPPRCMGTWQIIHIRKFGGSEAFKFQTGGGLMGTESWGWVLNVVRLCVFS